MFTVTGRLRPAVPVVTLVLCDSTPRCVSCHIAAPLCHRVCSTAFYRVSEPYSGFAVRRHPSMWGAAPQPLNPSYCRRATAVRLLSTGFRCCRLGQVPHTPPRVTKSHPRATPFPHCVVWMFLSVVAVQLCVCARAPPLLLRCCRRRAALASDDDAAAA